MISTKHELCEALTELRLTVGKPSVDTLILRAKRLGLWLARSTAYDALNGTKMPSRETTLAIVAACHGEVLPDEQKLWSDAWRRATSHNLDQQRRESDNVSDTASALWENDLLAGQAEGIVRLLLDSVDPAEAVYRLAELGSKLVNGLAHETNIEATTALLIDADDAAAAAHLLTSMDPRAAVRVLSRVNTTNAASWLSHMSIHETSVLMLLMDTDAMAAALLLMGGPTKAAEINLAIAFGAALESATHEAEVLAAQDRPPDEGAELLLSLDMPTGVKLLLTAPAEEAAEWLRHLPEFEAGVRLALLLEWMPDSGVAVELGLDTVTSMLSSVTETSDDEAHDI